MRIDFDPATEATDAKNMLQARAMRSVLWDIDQALGRATA